MSLPSFLRPAASKLRTVAQADGASRLDSLIGIRLATSVREHACVARRANGTFAALIPYLGELEDVPTVAARLVAAMAKPAERDGVTYGVQARAGATVYPDRARTFQSLFATANAALRRASGISQSIGCDPVPPTDAEPYRFRLLAWQDAYACGVDVFDEQHCDTLERINQLPNELLFLNKEGSGLLEAFEGLVEAAARSRQTSKWPPPVQPLSGKRDRKLTGPSLEGIATLAKLRCDPTRQWSITLRTVHRVTVQ